MIGPGKYDPLCTHVRTEAKARGALVMVFGGEHGNGFSVQADLATLMELPELLERMARDIRESGPFA